MSRNHEQITSKSRANFARNHSNNQGGTGTAAGSPPFIDSQEKTLGLIRLGGSFALPFKKYSDGQFLRPVVIDISAVLRDLIIHYKKIINKL